MNRLMPKTAPLALPTPVEHDEENDIVVSFSELDTYRQCPLKHFLAYKQRWSKGKEEGSALHRGSLWHVVMEAHYQSLKADDDAGRSRSLARAADRVAPLLFNVRGGRQTEDQELIHWMYEGYVEKYGTDDQWEFLGIEYKLVEWIPDPEGGDSDFLLKGKLDLIVRDRKTRQIWVVDHKSGANLPSNFELDIDDQFGVYTWLMQHRGFPIMGTIHNAARTTRNQADFPGYKGSSKAQTLDVRMARTLMNRGKEELKNLMIDAFAVATHIYPPEGKELPTYSSPDPRQCGWKCDFKEIHLLARKGRPLPTVLDEYGFVQRFERH